MKHIVGFSGGADSQATALWCRRQFDPADVILLYADPGGNDNEITTAFIENYSRTVHPVTVVRPIVADMSGRAPGKIAELGLRPTDPLTFDLLAKLKGRFPSTQVRFCTSHLKMYPQLRWMRENADGLLAGGYERYIGVRRDESAARANVSDREWDEFFDCWLIRPIAAWTKDQVFAYLAEAGEEINPLYRMGFNRVGCSPCINSGKDTIREWAARLPADVERVRRWERDVGWTFFPPIMPDGKGGRRHGFIDEVIAWAKTERGGKQISLPFVEVDADAETCVSKYGLCE